MSNPTYGVVGFRDRAKNCKAWQQYRDAELATDTDELNESTGSGHSTPARMGRSSSCSSTRSSCGARVGHLAADVMHPKSPREIAGVPGSSNRSISSHELRRDRKHHRLPQFDMEQIDVIHADDDEMFVEISKHGLAQFGIPPENVTRAEDGLAAMEQLLAAQAGDERRPLLLLLDVQMPNMDGQECALRTREMLCREILQRPPFLVGCSSHFESNDPSQIGMSDDTEVRISLPGASSDTGSFDALLPKNALGGSSGRQLTACLSAFQRWWENRAQPKGTPNFIPSIRCIIADDWPICRMSFASAFQQCGVVPARIVEANNGLEALAVLEALVRRSKGREMRPLMVLLGHRMSELSGTECAKRIQQLFEEVFTSSRSFHSEQGAFLVCTAEDPHEGFQVEDQSVFHCFLPQSFTIDDVRWTLELFRLWWLDRTSSRGSAGLLGSMQAWRSRRDARRREDRQNKDNRYEPLPTLVEGWTS